MPDIEQGGAREDEATRFHKWPLASLHGGYEVCRLLDTSPTINGKARETLHRVAEELSDEMTRKEDPR